MANIKDEQSTKFEDCRKLQFKNCNSYKKMREYKISDALTQKRRQQLRANNHDLRQLERHLQLAVVSKQLSEQQKIACQQKEEVIRKKREEHEKIAVECELYRKSVLCQEQQEKQNKKMLLETLQSQIREMQQKRQKDFAEVKKDRTEMEKLLKQIEAEDVAKRKHAELLRERFRKEMEMAYRDIWQKQQLEKEINNDDNIQYLAHQKANDLIKSQREAERRRIQKEKEDVLEHVGKKLASINLEKEKREGLLLSLSIEECRAKDHQNFREALAQQVNHQEKIRVEMENYRLASKIHKEKKFKDEEEKFREEHLHYLEERDKVWQLSEEKRRRKKMEYFKALRKMIEERRCQKANEIAQQIAELNQMKNDVEESNLLIEKERRLLLSAVPKDLLSYLPPGVLKSSDKEFLTCL